MRVPRGRMTTQQRGVFLVRASGLQTGKEDSGWRLMFSRPYLGGMVGQILCIVVCAIGTLLSLLLPWGKSSRSRAAEQDTGSVAHSLGGLSVVRRNCARTGDEFSLFGKRSEAVIAA
jgi:hypothetical protein